MKEFWTVRFEYPQDGFFESEEGFYRDIKENGITHWRYHCPSLMLPWQLLKKEQVEGEERSIYDIIKEAEKE